MSEFLQHLRGDARLEARGQFSLDLEQAKRKMSRFQLRHPHDFLYHMVAGLFHLGASRLDVEEKNGLLCLAMPALPLRPQFLEDLAAAIFEEESGLRRLAAAAQSLLAYELVRFDWIGSRPEQCFDYLCAQGRNWTHVSLCEIHIQGLPRPILDGALEELAQRGAWSRRPLRVGVKRFQAAEGLAVRFGEFFGECEWCPGEKSQLVLVMDEIAAEKRPVDTPFAWSGVCYGKFRLDASLAQVVEDETLEKVLQDVPNTYLDCVRRGLPHIAPELTLPLLSRPLPTWLEPLASQLQTLPLFADQHRRAWTLSELLDGDQPVYVADSGQDSLQLDVSLLLAPSAAGLRCLEAYLGSRLQKVDPLLLRQLQRQHNLRVWQEQPVQSLQLPARHWLYQQEFQHGLNRWVVGIPDDWSALGANIAFWIEGRKLCESKLILQEFHCELVCEVAPSQVNELWTGLEVKAWIDLEAHWNQSIEQVLQNFAGGREQQSEVRRYLQSHLVASPRPRDNYFRKTLLWEDWHGQLHSLEQLLRLEPAHQLGVVGPQWKPEDFPAELIPVGVYLRNFGNELKLLDKLELPQFLILDYLLEDLAEARSQAFQESSLEPLPELGTATIMFCRAGVCLEPITIGTPLAFQAWVRDELVDVDIKLANQAMGLQRFRPADAASTHQALDALELQVEPALRKIFGLPPEPAWMEWLRQATLRHLCPGFLEDFPCWPCQAPSQSLASLQQLREAEVIDWCSSSQVPPGFQGELLLTGLSHGAQSELMALTEETRWICRDEHFAREQEQIEFLRKPLWQPAFPTVLAQQKPGLWLVPLGSGRVFWLFQGRLIEEQVALVPYGFRLAVECPSLLAQDRPTDLFARCYTFLKEWLTAPRAPLWQHWQEWNQQQLPQSVLQQLQNQGWFLTNRGPQSWRQLMDAPELWIYEGSMLPIQAESLLLVLGANPLLSAHPNLHDPRETERKLTSLHEIEQQQEHARQQGQRLQGLRHRVAFEQGELALSGTGKKNVWLLDGASQHLVENLPAGLVGFIQGSGQPCPQRNVPAQATLSEELRS